MKATIKTLDELAGIDFKAFSNLEGITFALENGALINERATLCAEQILNYRDREIRLSKGKNQGKKADSFLEFVGQYFNVVKQALRSEMGLVYGLPLAINLVVFSPFHIPSLYLREVYLYRKINARSYKTFVELIQRIQDAYAIVECGEAPYRQALPRLEYES